MIEETDLSILRRATRVLSDIALAFDSVDGPRVRVVRSAELMGEVVPFERCGVLVRVGDHASLELLALGTRSWQEHKGLEGRLRRIHDLIEGGEPSTLEASLDSHHMALPLVSLDRLVGLLFIERTDRAFSPSELRFAALVGSQVSAYLAMLRLHRETQDVHRFKQDMIDTVVHDFKNPLGAMIANIDYLDEQLHDVDSAAREALSDLQSSATRILRLIESLIAVSKLESSSLELRREPVDLCELLESLMRQRNAAAKARRIVLAPPLGEPAWLDADIDLMTRVFENILENAFRYVPAGGRIEASVERTSSLMRVRIGNSGRSVPAELREAIFEKHARSGSGGRMNLGLGLYFCRLVIHAHGGKLWVDEHPDLPAVFCIELPCVGDLDRDA